MTTTQGSFTIIINNSNRILMLKRRDYPLWDLPGGRLENAESFIECAKREAYEETGYNISIIHKVGTYNRSKHADIQHVYFGKIINGNPLYSTEETKDLKWFDINKLPLNMAPNRRRQIKDFKSNCKNLNVNLKDLNPLLFIEKILKFKRNHK